MKRCRSLFSPAVGSKANKSKYPVDDYRNYDVIVEPFAHAGPIAIERLLNFGKPIGCRNAIVSDSDLSVYAIWKTWLDESLMKDCSQIINDYHLRLSSVKTTKDEMKNSEAFSVYLELKEKFNFLMTERSSDYSTMAAVSLLLRKLVFGGVIRTSRKGLNVTLSWDKLKSFPNWNHQWHQLDPLCNVDISMDWRTCLDKLEESNFKRALVLIDPPYWLPYEPGSKRRGTGAMTQAYTVHKPSDDETFLMATESVERCLAMDKNIRVVMTNYWSRPLQLKMQILSRKYQIPVHTTQMSVLAGMNKSRVNTTNRIETAWEFGGNRMFWPKNFVPVEQKDLCVA
jgi:hypothetical protein